MTDKKVFIGCHSAFWGDSSFRAVPQLVSGSPDLDYLVSDYLAEVTMGILAKSKDKARGNAGKGGYVKEFVTHVWQPYHQMILERGVTVITNAGGLAPESLKKDIEAVSPGVKVACVVGDDTLALPDYNYLEFEGQTLPELGDATTLSANAYFGALPILKALQAGAQVIITGRCADSALVLAPLMYEFGWGATDYDLLAAGSLAGHIIECGCQCTGGNFTDWQEVDTWVNNGFPVIECASDGTFVVTKPPETGGIVTRGTVAEQMLYEIGDPSTYILPDVIVDFRQVQIAEEPSSDMYERSNRVRVSGARGRAPTPFYKVSITRSAGYSLNATLLIGGTDARRKAQAVGEAILANARLNFQRMGIDDFDGANLEILGTEATYGPNSTALNAREVILRISVRHKEKRGLLFLGAEIAPSATSMAPGITGGGAGRPRPSSALSFHSALISKEMATPSVVVGNAAPLRVPHLPLSRGHTQQRVPDQHIYQVVPQNERSVRVPLISIALGRSGDKGDSANIGIISREDRFFPVILQQVTAARVKEYMGHLVRGDVTRWTLPGTSSVNFLLKESLGGGGLESLRIDRQGKTYAQQLLTMPIEVPASYAISIKAKL